MKYLLIINDEEEHITFYDILFEEFEKLAPYNGTYFESFNSFMDAFNGIDLGQKHIPYPDSTQTYQVIYIIWG